jgi:hypothetical protein
VEEQWDQVPVSVWENCLEQQGGLAPSCPGISRGRLHRRYNGALENVAETVRLVWAPVLQAQRHILCTFAAGDWGTGGMDGLQYVLHEANAR